MADEQPVPIYLSPEEELTSVRERLEKTQARRIILVIPPQTQLRSHVGWRLIHARMRELGKELTVISPDRQVRAVARAAGFRVADSQESPSNRSRQSSSSTRPGTIHTRGAARSRIGNSRSGPDSRTSGSGRRQTSGMSNRPLTPLPLPDEHDVYAEDLPPERSRQQRPEPKENQSITPPATLFKEPESHKRSMSDFHISTTPSVRPSVPGHMDEDDENEDDIYYNNDYHTAQRIRESASASGYNKPAEQDVFPMEREQESRSTGAGRWDHDPFAHMEDEQQQTRLPEQKGSMPGIFEETGTNVPDISDRSTEIMESEIEDLGDMGALIPAKITPLPREQSARPRRPSGQIRSHSPRSPRPGSPSLDDDDELLAIPDRPTQFGGPSTGSAGSSQRPSQVLRPNGGPRPSQVLRSDQAPPANPRPSQVLRSDQAPRSEQRARPASTVSQRTPVRPQSAPQPRQPISRQQPRPARRSNRGLSIFFTVLILLLIVLGLLFYFAPTATVTISLQAQSYSQNVQLNATISPQTGTPGSVQAQMLEHDFSTVDQGTASGQARVGDASAQGLVTFTNNGNTDVTIPTGTIITTQSGIPFATSAEAFVPHGGTYPAVPVTAQQTGVAGNVSANSITSIPTASLSSIAQYNHTTTQTLSLTVANGQATSGGGVKNVPAVTQQDLQALEHTLHQSMQQQVTAWLTAQTQPGDLSGTPIPNVLKSTSLLPAEQLSGIPAVGQAENNGTFSGTLTLHIKVLIARAAQIKAAAGTQLDTSALKLRPASMLATQLPITLVNEKGTPSQDGNTLAISAKATGAIVRQISSQDVSGLLVGKGIDQAASDLKSSLSQAGIQDVQISVTPAFLSIMPLRADRIRVILQPIPLAIKSVPNG